MNLFYTTDIEGTLATLPAEEAHHCAQVLRKQAGDAITLVDGRGGWYEGQIETAGKRGVTVRIASAAQQYGQRPFRLHLGIAPTKNIARMEWLLEKITEVGVDTITPLRCRHSERRELRTDRLEKIILAAMKQSLKAYLPTLHEMQPFDAFVDAQAAQPGQRFIAYIDEAVRGHLKNNYLPGQDVCILIGPEGDFAPEEVQRAVSAGFLPVSLGSSRLRTETAGLAACHIVNLLNE